MPLARLAGAPGAIPLLGHAIRLRRSPLGFLSSLPAHGDLVKIRLGRKPALVVCTPDLCQQVLGNPDIFDKGGTLFARARSLHRRQRRIIPAIPFTRAVIIESLRIHPRVWLLTRVVKEDTMFAGHLVRSGTVIVLSPYIIHHRADLYPDPEEFDPTRWLEHPPARTGYIPFGDGARRCSGDMFGLTEAALALASIAARWRLRPIPGIRVCAVPRAVVHPVPLPMRLEIR